jgi:hypothetical protein
MYIHIHIFLHKDVSIGAHIYLNKLKFYTLYYFVKALGLDKL